MPHPGDVLPQHAASELAKLQAAFPAFRIWREAAEHRTRLVAVRRHYATRPYAVITADPRELRATLAAAVHGQHQ